MSAVILDQTEIKQAPTADGQFLLGNMNEFRDDVLDLYSRMAQQYPEIVRTRIAHKNVFMVIDPELIREFLVKRASEFPKTDLGLYIMEKALNRGLLATEGDFHRRQRKLMQPAFHHKRLQGYGDVICDYTAHELADWQDGETRNIAEDMMRLTMFVVAKTLFDADRETMADKAQAASDAIASNQYWLEKEFFLGFKVPLWMPTKGNRAVKQNKQILRDILLPIVEERRQNPDDDRGDFLSMLLTAEADGYRMDDELVIDEMVTLFSAGHETTSNALTWTLYLLSQNPEVEAKLHAELDEVLDGRAPTLADLKQLTYTNMVLKESMRILPPVWSSTFHESMADTHLGGYEVPKGSLMVVPIYGLHRSPTYFPDAEAFRPERFDPETGVDLPRYAYMPFGAGPHVCIGAQFAMMEAQLILAAVCSKYRLRLHEDQVVEPEPLVTMSPKYGMNMILEER